METSAQGIHPFGCARQVTRVSNKASAQDHMPLSHCASSVCFLTREVLWLLKLWSCHDKKLNAYEIPNMALYTLQKWSVKIHNKLLKMIFFNAQFATVETKSQRSSITCPTKVTQLVTQRPQSWTYHLAPSKVPCAGNRNNWLLPDAWCYARPKQI